MAPKSFHKGLAHFESGQMGPAEMAKFMDVLVRGTNEREALPSDEEAQSAFVRAEIEAVSRYIDEVNEQIERFLSRAADGVASNPSA